VDSSWLFNLGADVYGWFTAQAAWRESCRRLAQRLADLPEARVADLGCGPGVSTFELARLLPSAHLTGIDVAPRMLGQARRRYRDQRDLAAARRIAWLRADAACLPFASASLDACTGHSFLYLVANREAVLAEVRRVLKPGGRLVLMEPNARRVTLSQALSVSRDPRHLFSVSLWRPFSRFHGRFTSSTLVATLQAAGFSWCEADETFGGLGVMGVAVAPANSGVDHHGAEIARGSA
jgi:ubiquinone/menaquinone biosynthesis C-methylase UbiE